MESDTIKAPTGKCDCGLPLRSLRTTVPTVDKEGRINGQVTFPAWMLDALLGDTSDKLVVAMKSALRGNNAPLPIP